MVYYTLMGRGGSPEMMRQRLLEIVDIFKNNGALSPGTAKTQSELELPPYFPRMMQMRLEPLGIVVEKDGNYYLVEEKIKKL